MKKNLHTDYIRPTMNNMGISTTVPNELTEAFLLWVEQAKGHHLDIGAAYGIATLPALAKGAHITAVDLSQAHLDILLESCPENLKKKLITKTGRLPYTLQFAPNSFEGIHISQVLHFLRGVEIEESLALAFEWLKPGGKIFTLSCSPYTGALKAHTLPYYEERKKQNIPWPGELENVMDYSNHPITKNMPPFFHLLEDTILRQAFEKQGFIIERCELGTIELLPADYQNDGREDVYLIARKP